MTSRFPLLVSLALFFGMEARGVVSRLSACRSESCGRKDGLILRSVRRGARAEASGAYSACVQLNAFSRHVNFGSNSPEAYRNS